MSNNIEADKNPTLCIKLNSTPYLALTVNHCKQLGRPFGSCVLAMVVYEVSPQTIILEQDTTRAEDGES
jgi:hypothetical protein